MESHYALTLLWKQEIWGLKADANQVVTTGLIRRVETTEGSNKLKYQEVKAKAQSSPTAKTKPRKTLAPKG